MAINLNLINAINFTNDTLFNSSLTTLPCLLRPGCIGFASIVLAISLSMLIFLTIFGNILVFLSICCYRYMQSFTNILLISLATADVLVGILILPPAMLYLINGTWPFNQVLCKVWATLDVLLCTASILNLCVISLDRYFAISYPMRYLAVRNCATAAILIAAVWIIALLVCLPPWLNINNWGFSFDEDNCGYVSELSYRIYSSVGSFFAPTFVMLYVYYRIYMVTVSREKTLNNNRSKSMRIKIHRGGGGKKKTGQNQSLRAAVQSTVPALGLAGNVSRGSLPMSRLSIDANPTGIDDDTSVNDATVSPETTATTGSKYNHRLSIGTKSNAGDSDPHLLGDCSIIKLSTQESVKSSNTVTTNTESEVDTLVQSKPTSEPGEQHSRKRRITFANILEENDQTNSAPSSAVTKFSDTNDRKTFNLKADTQCSSESINLLKLSPDHPVDSDAELCEISATPRRPTLAMMLETICKEDCGTTSEASAATTSTLLPSTSIEPKPITITIPKLQCVKFQSPEYISSPNTYQERSPKQRPRKPKLKFIHRQSGPKIGSPPTSPIFTTSSVKTVVPPTSILVNSKPSRRRRKSSAYVRRLPSSPRTSSFAVRTTDSTTKGSNSTATSPAAATDHLISIDNSTTNAELNLRLGREHHVDSLESNSVLSGGGGALAELVTLSRRVSLAHTKPMKILKEVQVRSAASLKERKALKTISIVVSGFIICWFPFFVGYLLESACSSPNRNACSVPPVMMMVFLWLGYSNSAINPVIYAFTNNDFRRCFRDLLTCGCAKKTFQRSQSMRRLHRIRM